MKKFIVGLAVVSFMLVQLSIASFAETDWAYWNTENISGKLFDVVNENLDSVHAKLEGEWRFADDMSDFNYNHIDVGLSFKKLFVEWFTLGLNYRQVWVEKSTGWQEEGRPHVNGTVSFKFEDWKIKNRVRVEYRLFETAEDRWRFRNKLTVTPPMKWTEWGIYPYIADEIFVYEDDGLNRNRLYAGLGISKLFNLDHLKGDLFFLWQVNKDSNDDWDDNDLVIGTKLKAHF